MLTKYKKLKALLIVALVAVSFLGLGVASFPTPATAATCIADNSSICSGQGCTTGKINCNSGDPAATSKTAKCGRQTCDFVGKYINPLIQLLSLLVGVASVISIIYAGIQYTTSAGDPKKVSDAKNRITKTVMALLAYAFLYGFLQFLVPGGLFNRS